MKSVQRFSASFPHNLIYVVENNFENSNTIWKLKVEKYYNNIKIILGDIKGIVELFSINDLQIYSPPKTIK